MTDTEEQRSLWDRRRKGRPRAGPARPLDAVWEEDVFIIFSVVKPSSSFFCQHRVRSGDAEDTGEGSAELVLTGRPSERVEGAQHPPPGGPTLGRAEVPERAGDSPAVVTACVPTGSPGGQGVMGCRHSGGVQAGRREELGGFGEGESPWNRGLGHHLHAHGQPSLGTTGSPGRFVPQSSPSRAIFEAFQPNLGVRFFPLFMTLHLVDETPDQTAPPLRTPKCPWGARGSPGGWTPGGTGARGTPAHSSTGGTGTLPVPQAGLGAPAPRALPA